MPAVNTNAEGTSVSSSDVIFIGLSAIVVPNTMPNSYGETSNKSVFIHGGRTLNQLTPFISSHTCGPGLGVCSGTNSGCGMLFDSSGKFFIQGSGVTYHGSYGVTNNGNTFCVQSVPSQHIVYVSS